MDRRFDEQTHEWIDEKCEVGEELATIMPIATWIGSCHEWLDEKCEVGKSSRDYAADQSEPAQRSYADRFNEQRRCW